MYNMIIRLAIPLPPIVVYIPIVVLLNCVHSKNQVLYMQLVL